MLMMNSVSAKSGFSKWMTLYGEGVYFGTARSDESALTRERVRLVLEIATFSGWGRGREAQVMRLAGDSLYVKRVKSHFFKTFCLQHLK